MDERVHRAGFLGAYIGIQVESFDLPSKVTGKPTCIKVSYLVNARLTSNNIGPRFVDRITYGANATKARHNYAATAHSVTTFSIESLINLSFFMR